MNTGGYANALAPAGTTVNPGYFGRPAAASALGQPRSYQPNATRAQKPTHVKVPISTLIGLLLAEAPKPVMPRSAPMQRPVPAAYGGMGQAASPSMGGPPTVSSLYAMLQRRRQPRITNF